VALDVRHVVPPGGWIGHYSGIGESGGG
jgi:hypothetical protein